MRDHIKRLLLLSIFIYFSNIKITKGEFKIDESYIGCYRNVHSTKTKPSVYNVLECVEFCVGDSSNMVALTNGKKCDCIDRLDSAVASSRCDIPCSNNDTCGSGWMYSVYKGKSRILHDALFAIDKDNLQKATVVTNLPLYYDLEMCAHICLELNLTFFQTMEHNKCTCLDAYSYLTPRRTQTMVCNTECNDAKEICACHYQGIDELPIVFSTRFQYDFQRGKSIYYHCKEKTSELFSTCASNCSNGWKGVTCDVRDCSLNNGDCGREMKCVKVLLNSYEYVECVCPYGTVRNKWNLCEVYRANIALFKPSNMSSVFHSTNNHTSYGANYINDNVYDGFTYSKIADNDRAWISVDLTQSLSVGFVRVYNKICESEVECRALEKFVIRLNKTFNPSNADVRSSLNTCGHGPSQALQSGNPMVVICENFTLQSRYVIIQQSDIALEFGKLAVAELEIYEVGCDILNGRCKSRQKCTETIENSATFISCDKWHSIENISKPFYGCFGRVDAEYHHDEYGLSYEACKKVCNSKKFILSVMKAGMKCSCGNNVKVYDQISKELCRLGEFQSHLVYYTCFIDNGFCNDVSNEFDTTMGSGAYTKSSGTDIKIIVIGALCGSIFVMSVAFAVLTTIKIKRKVEEEVKNEDETSQKKRKVEEEVKNEDETSQNDDAVIVDSISMDSLSTEDASKLENSLYQGQPEQ